MYPYIVCFCGRSLGDIHDLFMAMCKDKVAETCGDLDIDPNFYAISSHAQVELNDVFNALHLHLDCCRLRMLGQVAHKDLY